jgi:hypothetical protein
MIEFSFVLSKTFDVFIPNEVSLEWTLSVPDDNCTARARGGGLNDAFTSVGSMGD